MLDPVSLIARQNSVSHDTLTGTVTGHRMLHSVTNSVRLVADQGNDHAVQVEEKHQKVETQFDKGFLESRSAGIPSKDDVNPE
jgi:hypothetical protein